MISFFSVAAGTAGDADFLDCAAVVVAALAFSLASGWLAEVPLELPLLQPNAKSAHAPARYQFFISSPKYKSLVANDYHCL